MAEARRARRIAVVVPEGVSAQTVPLQVERIAERMVTGDRDVCRRLNRDSRRIPEDAIGPDPRPVSAREVEDPERPVVDRPIVEDDVARRPQTDPDPQLLLIEMLRRTMLPLEPASSPGPCMRSSRSVDGVSDTTIGSAL